VAEQEEEIIIIEEEDAAEGNSSEAENSKEEEGSEKEKPSSLFASKKKLFIIIGAVVFLLIIVISVVLLSGEEKVEDPYRYIDITEAQTEPNKPKKMSISQLEKMIKRANIMYTQGDKKEALKLYKKIATYNESISYYNLGVSELQQKQYEKAIINFELAIKNKQNLCVSAINAAVASLELGDKERFENYINLAHSYLPIEASSPLYSYYYALVNFYQENYLEALSPLQHRSSEDYTVMQNQLSAKINFLFSSYHNAVAELEKQYQDENALSLGLLYANIGDSILAKKYLGSAIAQGLSPVKSQLALAYVNLKSGQVHTAANLIENISAMYPQDIYKHYPVETFLKKSLFDVNLAQHNFHNNIIHNPNTIYEILFYFAPYKIFNADKTISYIRKGNANISIDNISGVSSYLNESASLSSVNIRLAKAIQMALNFNLLKANKELKKLAKEYPRHSIVQYDLALTYAQLGDINLAFKHFKKSHHLDAKNYLSGIFTMMSAKLTNQESKKFNTIIKDNLTHEDKDPEHDLYRALIHFKEGNLPATYAWMEHDKKESPFNLAFDILIAMSMDKVKFAQEYSEKLIQQIPHDVLPHLLYIDAHYSSLEQKMFARKAITHLKRQKFTMNDFYYGPFITQYLYTQYAQITGSLHPLKLDIRDRLSIEKDRPVGIMQALALASIYTQDFEEAYTIYNQLIDQYTQHDAHTLFLAAIAATGAKHPANAIALLELAKRKNPKHSESRYALGLLYLQTQNNEGAVVAFKNIKEENFQSQFFNFKIQH